MKNPDRVTKIISTYFGNRFPQQLEEKVRAWLTDESRSEEKEKALSEVWDSLHADADASALRSLEQVKSRLGWETRTRHRSLGRIAARIAAVFLPLTLVLGGVVFYTSRSGPKLVEVAIAHGDKLRVVLPDSSEVWVNAGSRIAYSSRFKGKERTVQLSGEAYFRVTSDPRKPFVVRTDHLTATVLGTEFNVQAYPDEPAVVTLNSGSIRVDIDEQSTLLSPGQQLTYAPEQKTRQLLPLGDDAMQIPEWRVGHLIHLESTFRQIVQSLQRKFDVTIRVHESLLTDDLYHVRFVNDESLEEILDILCGITGGFAYRIDNKEIFIDPVP